MRRMSYQIIVGEQGGKKDSSLLDVVFALKSSDHFKELGEKLFDLATTLKMKPDTIKQLREEMEDNEDVSIYRLVQEWVGEKGKKANLEVLLDALRENDLEECADLLENRFTERNTSRSQMTLFKSTLPRPLQYYIERRLTTRTIISYKIFEQTAPDIILLSGMQIFELRGLLKKDLADKSPSQLKQQKLTVRFISLDQANHFDLICKKTTKPVHWIRKEDDGRLRWVKSRGKMTLLQKLFDSTLQDIYTEDEFCNSMQLYSRETICISDSPGMGTSVLLAEIGRKLEQLHPERLVTFLVISELMQEISRGSAEDKKKTIEVAIGNMVTLSPLGKLVLREKLESKEKIELLLDGLIEVDPSEMPFALEILANIKKLFPSIRLWITSRPHLLHGLEQTLNVLGYNMLPFSEEDEVCSLITYWNMKGSQGKVDLKRLHPFAVDCLKSLRTTLSVKDTDIAGTPMQCLMIAELFEEQALHYALPKCIHSLPEIEHDIKSISDLYERLVLKRLQKYIDSCGGPDKTLPIKDLLELHVKQSLRLNFPQEFKLIESYFKPTDYPKLLKVGIMERSQTTNLPVFIHRTFAEYFVAWFAVESLKNHDCPVNIIDFIFNVILKTEDFLYESHNRIFNVILYSYKLTNVNICHFLNSVLGDQEVFKLPLGIQPFLDKALEPKVSIRRTLAHACAQSNNFYIFNLFYQNEMIFNQDKGILNIFDEKFLLLTIQFSKLPLVEIVLKEFRKSSKFYDHICVLGLLLAVQRGSYSITEFLLKKPKIVKMVEKQEPKEMGKLLHVCVRHSDSDLPRVIGEKIKIIDLLHRINPLLVNVMDHLAESTPLLEGGVDARLLKKLLSLGADVFAQDYAKNTFLHSSLNRSDLSAEDYHDLVQSLDPEELKLLVHVKNHDRFTPLIKLLIRRNPLPETVKLFKEAGADFNYVDNNRLSVIAQAILAKRNGEIIRILLDCGANPNWRGDEGESLLHLAAESGNIEALRVLLEEEEMRVNLEDYDMKTPLDYAIENERPRTSNYLQEMGGLRGDRQVIASHRWLRRGFLVLKNKLIGY